MRELPETIQRLTKRLNDLSADLATANAHEHDPLTVGSRRCHSDDAMGILGKALDALPEKLREATRFPVGRYRGLAFGLLRHASGAADVYLEGAVTRHSQLFRDHQGPRAVLNALDRLADSYRGQCDATRQELAIAEGQLRDYDARLGSAFGHDAYQAELTALRDQLKAGLSQATPEPGTTPVAELAERIASLKAAHTVEAAPERTVSRRIVAEEPVTARIRRRIPAASVAEPAQEVAPVTTLVETPEASPATSLEPSTPPAVIAFFPKAEPPAAARPQPAYRQHVARARRQNDRQLSLF